MHPDPKERAITSEVLHTQHDRARFLVEERNARTSPSPGGAFPGADFVVGGGGGSGGDRANYCRSQQKRDA
jgi:hypothetical protein